MYVHIVEFIWSYACVRRFIPIPASHRTDFTYAIIQAILVIHGVHAETKVHDGKNGEKKYSKHNVKLWLRLYVYTITMLPRSCTHFRYLVFKLFLNFVTNDFVFRV